MAPRGPYMLLVKFTISPARSILGQVGSVMTAAILMTACTRPGVMDGAGRADSSGSVRGQGGSPSELKLSPSGSKTPRGAASATGAPLSSKVYKKPDISELKTRLSALEFAVTQREATEPPFQNRYFDQHEAGIYVDIVTGEPLFSSLDKFDSGTGWPSFSRPIEPERVVERVDDSLGVRRVETRSKAGDSHLGHLFPDGPAPTRQRYCINSAALRFIPLAQLETEGYGAYLSRFAGAVPAPVASGAQLNQCTTPSAAQPKGCQTSLETAVLAGGCFWGMQDLLRKVPGVLETEVGYSGGTSPSPSYSEVKTGKTGHAEAVRIVFDPKQLSYAELLKSWFFRMHDPTTLGRQGNDVGSQYRSAIFTLSEEQNRVARRARDEVAQSGRWKSLIVTEITPFISFTRAEDDHQDYLVRHPDGYTCHYLRP